MHVNIIIVFVAPDSGADDFLNLKELYLENISYAVNKKVLVCNQNNRLCPQKILSLENQCFGCKNCKLLHTVMKFHINGQGRIVLHGINHMTLRSSIYGLSGAVTTIPLLQPSPVSPSVLVQSMYLSISLSVFWWNLCVNLLS